MNWQDIETRINQVVDEPFEINHHSSIGGGCINSAYKITGARRSLFIKFNDADRLDMFEAEAEGLQEMCNAEAVRVPEPVCTGTSNGQAFIVMEFIDMSGGARDAMATLGKQLAQMHRYSSDRFGWHRDNTIGSTPQSNDWCEDWLDFWREQRLGYQLKLASARGGGKLLSKGERLQADMHQFFTDYQPQASVLHGDLWSGNYGISAGGEPIIFDPAVYFGDREADLAMTELFGGFGRDFYAAYNSAWPLDAGYQIRKTFYNLYHIINHYNMFGGGYGGQAQSMLDRLLAELR